MIQYEVQLNQGNEALQTGKTITANEVLLTCDEKALAREIHHQNSLIPEDPSGRKLFFSLHSCLVDYFAKVMLFLIFTIKFS